ncbi:hypothetical protein BLNAU_10507 [Blattamonas nauphoetae]|uniref:Cyclin N-terminal domain-containing protein n=1 Tax=Blattamonas nauphoetae TaxID=2049346 RepID=A0ABQ9XPY1_9EUKA|nr:hypothetical protein BLNAU_10507 [Blattamonas nauphoetae]
MRHSRGTIMDGSLTRICFHLSKFFSFLFNTTVSDDHSTQPDPNRTSSSSSLMKKIEHFFSYVRQYTKATVGELLNIVLLIFRIAQNDNLRPHPIIQAHSLGMLLLAATVITQKTMRDHPLPNKWWAKCFGITTELLFQSELFLLQQLEYRIWMGTDEYKSLFSSFLLLDGAEDTDSGSSVQAG